MSEKESYVVQRVMVNKKLQNDTCSLAHLSAHAVPMQLVTPQHSDF